MTNYRELYNKWAQEKIKDNKREIVLKWKAINLLNLILRNVSPEFKNIAEIGGAEGTVLNTISKILEPKKSVNYEISDIFSNIGEKKYPNIKFFNYDFLDNPDYFDLIILSDITEHVEDDLFFLNTISKYCEYLAIKIPIEKSLFSSKFYATIRLKRISPKMKYGLGHINGHLRGYTIKQAKKYTSKYYNINDFLITDTTYFTFSKKNNLLKEFLVKKY